MIAENSQKQSANQVSMITKGNNSLRGFNWNAENVIDALPVKHPMVLLGKLLDMRAR